MGECLEFDTVEGLCVDEELFERCEVPDRDLALEQLQTFLEVANHSVKGDVCGVLAQKSLVRIGAWRGRHEYLWLFDFATSFSAPCSRLTRGSGAWGIDLLIQAAKTVIITTPVGLVHLDLLLLDLWFRTLGALSSQDIVYLLVSGLELIIIEELLVCLLLVEELFPLKHLLGLFSLLRSQIGHWPLKEV